DAGREERPCRRHGRPGDEPDDPHDRGHRGACRRHRESRPRKVTADRPILLRTGAAFAALVLLVAALGMGAAVGETAIPLDVVAKTVANRLWQAGHAIEPIDEGIIWNYRLSRAVVAACCGSALALCGVILQSLLRNALADPYILGISAGASTGAVAVAILGIGAGILTLPIGAFLGALVAF